MLSSANQQLFKKLLEQAIEGADVFVVETKFVAPEKVEIYLDSEAGITIEKCTKVARYINKQLEEIDPELMYELEVSSAGLEHPLQSLRQYQKNIGRMLEVNMPNDKLIEGKLLTVDEIGFTIEVKVKAKKSIQTFAFADVKEVFVGVSFN
jgi:ribosome maturation factor RimP